MENEPQPVEQHQHKLRNLIIVVSSLVVAGILGAEFLPWIVHIFDRAQERVGDFPLRRIRRLGNDKKP